MRADGLPKALAVVAAVAVLVGAGYWLGRGLQRTEERGFVYLMTDRGSVEAEDAFGRLVRDGWRVKHAATLDRGQVLLVLERPARGAP